MTLLYLALVYLAGIVLGRLAWERGMLGCEMPAWLWLPPLALLPLAALLNRWQARMPVPSMRWPVSAGFKPPPLGIAPGLVAGMLLCVTAGGLRYAARPLTPCLGPQDLAYWNEPAGAAFDRAAAPVMLEGHVAGFPTVDQQDRQEVVVDATQIEVDGTVHDVTGRARLLTGSRPRYAYGDPVRVIGRLETPPVFEDFSYRDYLAGRGIHSLVRAAKVEHLSAKPAGTLWRRWAATLRRRGLALLLARLPEPQASLAAGMLLGVEAGIPDALYERFRTTGTSHVIVISGSNVALISGMLLAAFRRVLGRRAMVPALAGIAFYAVVVGGDATVVRAAIMGGLVVIAVALQRRSTGLVSLAVAVWAMALVSPAALWDVGLQLSAAATVGLMLFSAPMQRWLAARWPRLQGGALTGTATADSLGALLRGVVVDGGVMTAAATLLTLPLVAYHFHRVSLVGLLANLLIVPAQPLILTAGTAGIALGLTGLPWAAQGMLWATWLGLWWTEQVVSLAAALPGASWATPPFGLGALAAVYAVIAMVSLRDQVKRRLQALSGWRTALHPVHLTRTPALLALGVLAGLGVLGAVALPDGKLHVDFLNVGQGDAILILTPSGRQVLVDGGANPTTLANELGAVMPFWDRSLEALALTHADADHMDAQTELPRRMAVGLALTTETALASADATEWRSAMQAEGTPVQSLTAGVEVDLGDGVTLRVINPDPAGYIGPDPDNETSLVLRVEYGAFRALLTGDAGLPSEADWLAQGAPLAATVLKVGHHGSKTGTGPDFVAAVQPQLAVIQVGVDNRYGHPAAETLVNLASTPVLRTDRDGRVEIITDGAQMWVRNAR